MYRIFFIYFGFLLGQINFTQAQDNKFDSIRYYLDAGKPMDTAHYARGLNLLLNFPYTDQNLPDLTSLSDGYTRTKNLDTSFAIKINILQGLGKIDNDKAIDYGRALYKEISAYGTIKGKLLRGSVLSTLRIPYRNSSRIGEGFSFFNDELKYFLSVKDTANISTSYYIISGLYRYAGLADQAIYTMKKSLFWSNTLDGGFSFSYVNHVGVLGEIYLSNGKFELSRQYSRTALELSKQLVNQTAIGYYKKNILYAFLLSGEIDSADNYIGTLSKQEMETPIDRQVTYNQVLALYHLKKKDYAKADSFVNLCNQLVEKYRIPASAPSGITEPSYYAALIRIEQKKYSEAIDLLELNLVRVRNIRLNLIRDHQMLAELYTRIGDFENANKAYANYMTVQKTLQEDQARYATLSFETEQQISTNELALTNSKNEAELAATTRNYSIGMAILLVLLGLGLLARYRSQKKTNHALGVAMSDLKASQTQLVHAEKMASLGELTAGIAHEIQNPLNFVNNFAESSKELLDEMKTALGSGDHVEATEIADDVILNLEKIHSHGKRADTIVKGMLQHSRSNSGAKEPTDINVLADEYLRLAYHGLRAKNASFNALTKTEFDQSIGNINIIPQDMGRVLLNIINNAFYAVDEKKKQLGDGYEPEVTVSTRLVGFNNSASRTSANPSIGLPDKSLIISVRDNGNGIPPEVQKKIFQPFFTTKPTGQGTGLGLSLSYDIIKAHGGEIKVNSKPGEGTEFRIVLPI